MSIAKETYTHAVFVFDNSIHPTWIEKKYPGQRKHSVPIRLNGLKRTICGDEPNYEFEIEKDDDAFCNGVLIPIERAPRGDTEQTLYKVDSSAAESYIKEDEPLLEEIETINVIEMGTPHIHSLNDSVLQQALDGASWWGTTFVKDFVGSTHPRG